MYKYQPLDRMRRQIRLLKIQFKEDSDAAIEGTLETHDLANLLPYRALSYTWGEPTPTHTIWIDGKPTEIRTNLFQFLSVYRSRHLNEYIWIDQLCIDQMSTSEKNHQVQMMADIYQKAFEVVIWLGVDEHQGQAAQIIINGQNPLEANNWSRKASIESLLDCQYWRRLWIVQEIILAQKLIIYYGDSILDWERFCKFLYRTLRDHENYLLSIAAYTQGEDLITLPGVLETFIKNKCVDPRDKYYGLQSLFEEGVRLQVDYSRPINDVFLDAAVAIAAKAYSVGHPQAHIIAELAYEMGVLTYWLFEIYADEIRSQVKPFPILYYPEESLMDRQKTVEQFRSSLWDITTRCQGWSPDEWKSRYEDRVIKRRGGK